MAKATDLLASMVPRLSQPSPPLSFLLTGGGSRRAVSRDSRNDVARCPAFGRRLRPVGPTPPDDLAAIIAARLQRCRRLWALYHDSCTASLISGVDQRRDPRFALRTRGGSPVRAQIPIATFTTRSSPAGDGDSHARRAHKLGNLNLGTFWKWEVICPLVRVKIKLLLLHWGSLRAMASGKCATKQY